MGFTVEDFQDLVRLLEQRPEWRTELRRLVLTEELLELPSLVRELAEAQRRTETEVRGLAEAQRATEAEVRGLAEAQRRAEERLSRAEAELAELVRAQHELAAAQNRFARTQDEMRDQLGTLRGSDLERRYREHAGGYFGRLLRRVRVVNPTELDTLLEQGMAAGALDEDAAHEVRLADLIVRGRRRGEDHDVYLVVEVSVVIGPDDVERAARRAAALAQVQPALAVVAGERLTSEAEALAGAHGVWRVLDGRVVAPPER